MQPPEQDPAERGGDFEELADDLYENAPCGYLSTRPDGTIVKVNRTFLTWTALRREDLIGQRRFAELLTGGGRIYHETHYAPLLALQGAVSEVALEIRCADGSRLPVFVNSVVKRDGAQQPRLIRTTIFKATDRRRYEHELLSARNRERESRERTELLQRITAALATRLTAKDIAETLLAELRALAAVDVAEVVLVDAIGDSSRVSWGSRKRSGAPEWRAAHVQQLPPRVRQTLSDGRPWFAEQPAGDEGEGEHCLAAVALQAGGERSLGALSLLSRSGTPLAEHDRALVIACALQALQALDRAALLRLEAEVAHTLQRSLLDSVPLDDPRIRVGSHYQPAVAMLEVGGDWHDVFPLPGEGRIGLVVGDVVGRGIKAAAAMGQLRSATRALAIAGLGGPGQVLAMLDRFVTGLPHAGMATVSYAEIDVDRGTVRYVCAGHPPPVLVSGREATLLWDGRRPPLGVPPKRGQTPEGQASLRDGDQLLLYTDGLVERRTESLDDGLARLVETIDAIGADEPQALVDELVSTLAGAQSPDDVCALCIRLDRGE